MLKLLGSRTVLERCFARISHRQSSVVQRLKYSRIHHWLKRTAAPDLTTPDRALLHTIQRRGVAETHLDDLEFHQTAAMWHAAQALTQTLPSVQNLHAENEYDLNGHCVHADAAKIATDYPEIIFWGLNERLLDVIENYMKCEPALIGIGLRKDSPNGQQIGTRLWHVDAEDKYVLKVLIYLDDVDEKAGPFEYVPKNRHNPKRHRLKHALLGLRHGFKKNQGFQKLVPQKHWRQVVSNAGTTIFADTATVFHHGAVAEAGERLALIYAYTTQNPKNKELCKKFFPRADLLPSLAPALSPRQRSVLLRWRGIDLDHLFPYPVQEATHAVVPSPNRSRKMRSRF